MFKFDWKFGVPLVKAFLCIFKYLRLVHPFRFGIAPVVLPWDLNIKFVSRGVY